MDFQALMQSMLANHPGAAAAFGHAAAGAGGAGQRRHQGPSVTVGEEAHEAFMEQQIEDFWSSDLCNDVQRRMGAPAWDTLGEMAKKQRRRGEEDYDEGGGGGYVDNDAPAPLRGDRRGGGGGGDATAAPAAFGQGVSARQKIAMLKTMKARLATTRAEDERAEAIAAAAQKNNGGGGGGAKRNDSSPAADHKQRVKDVLERRRKDKELCEGSAAFQGQPHRLPVKQKCTAAYVGGDRGVSVRFHPTTGDYVAWASSTGLEVFETSALLAETSRRQKYNTDTGVDIAGLVPPVSSPAGEATAQIGWSLLDVTWVTPNPTTAFAVAGCWAPTLIVQRVDLQHSKTEDPIEIPQENLDVSDCGSTSGNFCCFGVDALDHRVVACSTNDGYAFTYDIAAERQVWCTSESAADLNAVCKLTKTTFASGADNGIISIHDTRASPSSGASVYLLGHTNGIMSLSGRGDDIHLVSNSKDQAIKVWDLRKATNVGNVEEEKLVVGGTRASLSRWDYRSGPHVGPPERQCTKYDTSLRTFFGHEAYTTLCRARFSPLETTGGRYIVAGSFSNGYVLYDLLGSSAKQAGPLLVKGDHDNVVRDVSWHPKLPFVATSSWDGKLRLFGTDEADAFV